MRILILAALIAALPGCMTLTPQQRDFVLKARAQPLDFDVSEADAATTWSRAQVFLANYAPSKIQTSTESVLDTFNGGGFSYGVTRQRHPAGGWRYRVSCVGDGVLRRDGDRHAHIFALYIVTGEEPLHGTMWPEYISARGTDGF